MATGPYAYSTTAADNGTASSEITWSDSMNAASVDNSARQMMADLKKLTLDQGGALTLAGSANTYTLTTNAATDTLADGMRIVAVVNAANTGASTLNVNSKGAKAIRKTIGGADIALAGGEMQIGDHAIVEYDASANSAAGAWILLNPNPMMRGRPDIVLQDQKSAGTAGGTFTSGAWRTRTLNTEVYDPDGWCSLASNQFTLAAGSYFIEWSAPALATGAHSTRLYNTTGTATILAGTGETNATSGVAQTCSIGCGVFTIAASQALEIQHYGNNTAATNGFGAAGNHGETEVYTIVKLWRYA